MNVAVLFESDRILHEVRTWKGGPARPRTCLTCWVDGPPDPDRDDPGRALALALRRCKAEAASSGAGIGAEAIAAALRAGTGQRALARAVYREEFAASLKACMGDGEGGWREGGAEMAAMHERAVAALDSGLTTGGLVRALRDLHAVTRLMGGW